MDLTSIEEKIKQLSQLTKKTEKCDSLLKYINDNWNNIQEEKDRQNQRYKLAKLTNKKKKARRSYGKYENSLCLSVIELFLFHIVVAFQNVVEAVGVKPNTLAIEHLNLQFALLKESFVYIQNLIASTFGWH